jgi:hypothetical protein
MGVVDLDTRRSAQRTQAQRDPEVRAGPCDVRAERLQRSCCPRLGWRSEKSECGRRECHASSDELAPATWRVARAAATAEAPALRAIASRATYRASGLSWAKLSCLVGRRQYRASEKRRGAALATSSSGLGRLVGRPWLRSCGLYELASTPDVVSVSWCLEVRVALPVAGTERSLHGFGVVAEGQVPRLGVSPGGGRLESGHRGL